LPLKIGVNALYLKPGAVGGTEVYLRSLLAAMAVVDGENEWIVFANSETPRDLMPEAPNFVWAPQPVGATFRPGRILYEQFVLPGKASGVDVLFNPGFTAPAWGPKSVTVFHDLQHKRHPEHFRWFDLPFWDLLLWSSVKRSARLISVSDSTHADLLKYYGAQSDVIPHGVDAEYFAIGERRSPEKFLLCVSTLHPHKNHLRLIRAYSRFKKEHPDYRLVLAGLRGFAAVQIESEIARLGLEASIRVTGWIRRQELFDLYAHAAGVVYPSTFEGFGLPVLEAMAAQVPLASSNIEPMRSLVDGCALEFDPLNEDAIVESLERLVTAPPPPGPALDRARQFRWELAARKTLETLKSAAVSGERLRR
jgi:glycosyltransferase involved in cell wall biosynthesis